MILGLGDMNKTSTHSSGRETGCKINKKKVEFSIELSAMKTSIIIHRRKKMIGKTWVGYNLKEKLRIC